MSSRTEDGNQYSGGTIPSLDGIRALSVTLVLLSHGGFGDIIPGGLGVTIFFVLSGFLITTLMRTEYAKRGSIDFPAFYLRRFLRLMPPLFVATALSVAVSLLLSVGKPFTGTGLCSVLFYFSNYYRIIADPDAITQPPGLGVTWSLAVEEHYYLLFPPLALLLLSFKSRRNSAFVLGVLCTLILLWRCWLQLHGADENRLEMGTDTRVDAILIGCLMAMIKNPWLEPPQRQHMGRDLAVTGVCLLLMAETLLLRDPFFRATFRYTVQSVVIAVLMYMAVSRASQWPFRWLNLRWVAYIGTISYSIYLVHFTALMAVKQYTPGWNGTVAMVVSFAITVVIAALMQKWIEKPCHQLRRRLHDKLFTRGTARASVAGTS